MYHVITPCVQYTNVYNVQYIIVRLRSNTSCFSCPVVKLARDWSPDVSESVFDVVFNDTSVQMDNVDSTVSLASCLCRCDPLTIC